MAITYNIQKGETVNFAPEDVRGPWTFNAPAVTAGVGSPDHGVTWGINADTFGYELVTINTQGTAMFWDPSIGTTPVAQVVGYMTADALEATYDSEKDWWRVYSGTPVEPHFADLSGAPANFSPGSSFTAIQNWPTENHSSLFEYGGHAPDGTTGTIYAPRPGVYRMNARIIYQQGNDNKELAALLWVRESGSINQDYVIDALQISDDKTNWRSMGGSFLIEIPAAGDGLQLGMSWVNQSMGTNQMHPCTFEMEYVQLSVFV